MDRIARSRGLEFPEQLAGQVRRLAQDMAWTFEHMLVSAKPCPRANKVLSEDVVEMDMSTHSGEDRERVDRLMAMATRGRSV